MLAWVGRFRPNKVLHSFGGSGANYFFTDAGCPSWHTEPNISKYARICITTNKEQNSAATLDHKTKPKVKSK